MKKHISCCLLLFVSLGLYAQKLDLIVTTRGDSIACTIDSTTADQIYFTTLRKGSKVNISLKSADIVKVEYNVIRVTRIRRIPGSIYFRSKRNSKKEIYPEYNIRDFKPGSIYLTVGTLLLYAAADLSFERILFYRPESSFKFVSIKLYIGGTIEAFGGGESMYGASLTGLTGYERGHFELSAGILNRPGWGLLPSLSLGYRKQSPDKPYIFRTGVSYPESLYVSFGFQF